MLWRPQSNLPHPCTWSCSSYVVPVLCSLNWGLKLDFLKTLALKLSCSIVFPFPTPNAKAGLLTRSLMPFWVPLWVLGIAMEGAFRVCLFQRRREMHVFYLSRRSIWEKFNERFFFFLPSRDIAHRKRTVQLILGIYPEVQSLRKPPLSWKLKSLIT